jgi:uncharacterized membrane protein
VANPYRAPAAPVADLDRPRGSPLKGVIYGVLADIVGTTAATMLVMFIWGILLALNGASPEEIQDLAAKIDPTSAVGLLASAIGCGFSFLGGYVCARVAGRAELKWAAVMGVISTLFGLLMTMQVPRDAFNTVMLVASFVIVLLGGYVGARRNARHP